MTRTKRQQLEDLYRKKQITRAEYRRRLRQSAFDRDLEKLKPGEYSRMSTAIEARQDPQWLAKSFIAQMGAIFSPQDFEDVKVADLFTLFPTENQLFKTEFTMSPDANGVMAFSVYKSMNSQIQVHLGCATFGGLLYYPSGPNGEDINVFAYTDTLAFNYGWRLVGQSMEVSYEGTTLADSGVAVSCFMPPLVTSGISPVTTYAALASYDWSKTAPLRDGLYEVSLPVCAKQMTEFKAFQTTVGNGHGWMAYAAEGVNYSGTYPNAEARIRVVVYTLIEQTAIVPYASGSVGPGAGGFPLHPATAAVVQSASRHLVKRHAHHGSGWSFSSMMGKLGGWLEDEGAELLSEALPEVKKIAGSIAKSGLKSLPALLAM